MKKVELLAPAGTPQSLIAAVSGGADAVYMAGSRFGARAFAGNFNDEQLVEYIDYCHLRGVKVYITVNTLVKDDEIEDFVNYCLFLYAVGADALILQDIGMMQLLSIHLPDMELHASTQMTTNTAKDALFLKENFNIKRAVVSRELSFNEIKEIKKQTNLEIEAFVHGAICVSYSGKCLFSSLNGGRSANRGMCAQPCREQYFLSSDNKEQAEYILSPKDLNTIMNLDKIIESGVDSLKIEGRMKRPEYVFAVTNAYRHAIDLYYENDISEEVKETILKELYDDVSKVFNRGFTEGYILNSDKNDIMNSISQKSIGSEAAKVIEYDKKKKRLKLLLLDDMVKGDGLSTGEFVGRILKDEVICLQAAKDEIIELDCIKHFESGEIIFKTFDKKFMDKVDIGIRSDKEIRIKIKVNLYESGTASIDIEDEDANLVHYENSPLTQQAVNKAITPDEVKRQMLKLGDYIYKADNADVYIENEIYISAKNLNLLRREAIEMLNKKRIEKYKRKQKFVDLENITKVTSNKNINKEYKNISWSVFVNTKEQLEVLYEDYSGIIYIDKLDLYNEAIKKVDLNRIIFRLPPVIKQSDLNDLEKIIKNIKSRMMTSSAGMLMIQKHDLISLNYHMNLYNSLAHNFFNNKGIKTTISLETDISKSNELRYLEKPDMIEIPVYIYPELMITEFCPAGSLEKNCINCSSKLDMKNNKLESHNINFEIENKNDESFIFRPSINCKNIIYSKKPIELEKLDIKRFIDQGFTCFRIELMDENASQVKKLLSNYINI